MATEKDREFMLETIRLMRQTGCVEKTGGPFGCVIVKDEALKVWEEWRKIPDRARY